MSSYYNIKKIKNTINSINPSYINRLMSYNNNINNNNNNIIQCTSTKKKIPLIFNHIKNSIFYKAQKSMLNNDSNNISQKVLENVDLTNDISIKNNRKTSLSCNYSNINYYTNRRSLLYNKSQTLESDFSESRNYLKNNRKTTTRTTCSSFSFTDAKNSIEQLINGYDYEYQNKKNKSNYDGQLKIDNYNENNINNINKLIEKGIKYCIDKDGNPMNISDITLKNKKPIAFIIQKEDTNILVDLDDRIIAPNFNGDYILPNKPYLLIRKYDVQNPELRVINNNNEYIFNNTINNDININDEIEFRKKNNKRCNLYNKGESNLFFKKINIKNIQNSINNFNNSTNKVKNNIYKQFKNSLREKRKYIFINKLNNNNKSLSLKVTFDNNDYNANSTHLNKTFKINDKNKTFLCNNKDKECLIGKNNASFKLCIKNINGIKNKNNKLKDIKCFTQKEIKNLEFKFERKYNNKNNKNKNISYLIQPSCLSVFKFKNINEIQKEIKNDKEKIDNTKYNYNNIKNVDKNDDETKNISIEKIKKIDLKKNEKKNNSNSINLFMINNLKKTENIEKEKQKQKNYMIHTSILNALTNINHSYLSPPTETNSNDNILQNTQKVLKKNKTDSLANNINNNANKKGLDTSKFYIKPRIKSQKVFHKRIKTEDINRGEKKFRFFNSIKDNHRYSLNNSIKKSCEIDFGFNNCQHNLLNNIENTVNNNNNNNNNSVCKCPYCHHFFYN